MTRPAPRSGSVSAWWLNASVAAIFVHIFVTQLFPGVIAAVPWIGAAWSERVQGVAFFLGVIVLGVLVQAAWWGLRRRLRPR